MVLLEFLKPGDLLVYSNPTYGGTDHFINHFLPEIGIHTLGILPNQSIEEVKEAIEERSDTPKPKNRSLKKRTDKKKQSPGQRSQNKKINQAKKEKFYQNQKLHESLAGKKSLPHFDDETSPHSLLPL